MSLAFPVSLLFTPDEILVRGFRTIGGLPNITRCDYNRKTIAIFKTHFGPSPSVIACIWSDILTKDIDLGLNKGDKSKKGFKMFLTSIHFLWAYPKNAGLLASTCSTYKRNVEGESLWKWVRAIERLQEIKIVWPEEKYRDPKGQKFIISVDGVDMKTREKSTSTYNVDSTQYSQKFNHGGVKYEIAIDAFDPKIVSVNGPFRGGEADINIFMNKLAPMIPEGKLVIADRVYKSSKHPEVNKKFSIPNYCDSKELFNFKTRVRARHESLNGRLKNFRCLTSTYHHPHHKHVHVFYAVCVIVQYEMDCGSPIFAA